MGPRATGRGSSGLLAGRRCASTPARLRSHRQPVAGCRGKSMLTWAVKKVFGTSHERAIRRMKPRVDAINLLEDKMKALSDAELRAKTAEFRQKLENGATIDDLLVEAFAVCREASCRTLRMRHYDVQLIGAWCCTRVRSPKCEPVKERRWSRPFLATST